MIKQKKLQRDFLIKNAFPKKNLARAHFRARRAPDLMLLGDPSKSLIFGLDGRIFYRRARGSARAPEISSPIDSP